MNQHKQAGFTLTEMMVVIAIVGILLIVVIPNAVNVLDSAKTQGCDAYLKTVETQVQLYQLDHPKAGVPTMKDLVDTYVPSETCPDGKMITIDENGNVSAT
ncbi:MAG: competence type IV pilus major pilin ComGC [Culicoidibacterales bacterium]